MNFKFPWLTLLATVLYLNLNARESSVKWGKIPDEYLKMISCTLDTSAAALVLADIGFFRYMLNSPEQLTELLIHRRIKILKRSGFSEGDIEIPYYSKDHYQNYVIIKKFFDLIIEEQLVLKKI